MKTCRNSAPNSASSCRNSPSKARGKTSISSAASLDPEKQSGDAFAPIAKQIAEDADKLTDKEENWTEYAGKLDQMSLKTYLEQFRGKTDDWAIDLLDVGYNIEFGLETEEQSSLNMVDFIGTDLS